DGDENLLSILGHGRHARTTGEKYLSENPSRLCVHHVKLVLGRFAGYVRASAVGREGRLKRLRNGRNLLHNLIARRVDDIDGVMIESEDVDTTCARCKGHGKGETQIS